MDMKKLPYYKLFRKPWGCIAIVWVETLHCSMLLRDMITNSRYTLYISLCYCWIHCFGA